MTTLEQLPKDKSLVKPNRIMVRAFNGVTSEDVNNINLDLKNKPHMYSLSHFKS